MRSLGLGSGSLYVYKDCHEDDDFETLVYFE